MIIILLLVGLGSCDRENYKLVTIVYEEHLPSRIDTLTVQENCINIRELSNNGMNYILGNHANYTTNNFSGIIIASSTQPLKIIKIIENKDQNHHK